MNIILTILNGGSTCPEPGPTYLKKSRDSLKLRLQSLPDGRVAEVL